MKNPSLTVHATMTRLSRVANKKASIPTYTFRGQNNKLPSVDSGIGNAFAKDIPEYTGDKMIGIGQLHKSNAIPIFRNEDIISLSKMRR